MAGKTPKYQQIRDHLLQQIQQGELQAGDRLPVRSDLIAQYQVTRTTMDRALNELIRQGVLSSSKRGGTIVNGLPVARKRVAIVSRLSQDSLLRHGGMPNDLQKMFASMILSGSDRADVIFLDDEQVRADLDQLHAYDACIWVQPEQEMAASLQPFIETLIVTNRYFDNFHFASTNHRAAIESVTETYIKSLGTDIDCYYISAMHNHFIKQERLRGYQDACDKYNIQQRIIELPRDPDEAHEHMATLDLNPKRTNVIVSISSIYEALVLEVAQSHGLERGSNFYYADCDNDNIALGHRPAAITITQDYASMGTVAMEAAIDGRSVEAFIPYIVKGDPRYLT